ncbi:hypothetical protein M5K25_006558 [Dendrobium thyrsiflorum]|uniref:STAR protein homodimerisation region domain-containing protein n=1 Tax=Dendrobium thyrsiflorum TaxID=117978 RepID=A0ABD0VJ44_DENTH
MSGLYSHSFSPARTNSPQIRNTPDVDSQYLAELLVEHQKLGPFTQVLPICSRLLNQEIVRVSGVSSQGFGDYDRLQYGCPSPMASPNPVSNISVTGSIGWNGLYQESEPDRLQCAGSPDGSRAAIHAALQRGGGGIHAIEALPPVDGFPCILRSLELKSTEEEVVSPLLVVFFLSVQREDFFSCCCFLLPSTEK